MDGLWPAALSLNVWPSPCLCTPTLSWSILDENNPYWCPECPWQQIFNAWLCSVETRTIWESNFIVGNKENAGSRMKCSWRSHGHSGLIPAVWASVDDITVTSDVGPCWIGKILYMESCGLSCRNLWMGLKLLKVWLKDPFSGSESVVLQMHSDKFSWCWHSAVWPSLDSETCQVPWGRIDTWRE